MSYMVMKYFGLAQYGVIYSVLFSIYVFTGLSSALFTGYLIDTSGYTLLFMVDVGFFVAVAVVFWCLASLTGTRGVLACAA
jgi:hypothetical protein